MRSVDEGGKAIQRDVNLGSKNILRVTSGASSVLGLHHSQPNHILPSAKQVIQGIHYSQRLLLLLLGFLVLLNSLTN